MTNTAETTFTEAFPYATVTGYRAGVRIDGATWVHNQTWPALSAAVPLVHRVRVRGKVNLAHWQKVTSALM